MTTISYIIVDDEEGSRDLLRKFLDKYCTEAECLGQAENVNQAYDIITKTNPDLVFLDISMPDENGFGLLQKFESPAFEIIFVTAHEEYALRAIKNNAVDYLLKPIGIVELKDAVSRATARIANKRTQTTINPQKPTPHSGKMSVPVKDGYIYVNLHDIVRCEADGGYTWVYFNNKEKVLVTRTLKDFEEQLMSLQFVRVHHHHLINMEFVSKYNHGRGGQVIMADNAVIEVSQRKRHEFLVRLGVKD